MGLTFNVRSQGLSFAPLLSNGTICPRNLMGPRLPLPEQPRLGRDGSMRPAWRASPKAQVMSGFHGKEGESTKIKRFMTSDLAFSES